MTPTRQQMVDFAAAVMSEKQRYISNLVKARSALKMVAGERSMAGDLPITHLQFAEKISAGLPLSLKAIAFMLIMEGFLRQYQSTTRLESFGLLPWQIDVLRSLRRDALESFQGYVGKVGTSSAAAEVLRHRLQAELDIIRPLDVQSKEFRMKRLEKALEIIGDRFRYHRVEICDWQVPSVD